MTVKGLIEILQTKQQDLRIVSWDSEYDSTDIEGICEIQDPCYGHILLLSPYENHIDHFPHLKLL